MPFEDLPAVVVVYPPKGSIASQLQIPARDERRSLIERRQSSLRRWFETTYGPSAPDATMLPAVGAVILRTADFHGQMRMPSGAMAVANYAFSTAPKLTAEIAAAAQQAPSRKDPFPEPDYDPIIGMIDTGVAPHREFTRPGQLTAIQLDGLGGIVGNALIDGSGHGTFVGALIAGDSVGMLPGARLAVASAMARAEVTYADVLAGLDWLVGGRLSGHLSGAGCDLINISGGSPTHDEHLYLPLRTLLVQFGVLCVAAAGNDGHLDEVDSPADYDFCVGVGSHEATGGFYSAGTDWGSDIYGRVKPDLCSEGVGVWSASPSVPAGYVPATGTSYAAALVSGALARLIAANKGLAGHPTQMVKALQQYCGPLSPPDPGKSRFGRLNLSSVP